MLLTRKAAGRAVPQSRLARTIPIKTFDRRTFLKRSGITVGAGSAATAAAVVATKKSSQATTSGSGKRETRGYHATEHVNNYYRTAKV